jgi:hypothetical protein
LSTFLPTPPLGPAASPIEATEVDLPDRRLLLLHAHTLWTPDPAAGAGPTTPPKADLGSPSRLTALSQPALNALRSGRSYAHAGVLAARTRTFDSNNVASWDLAHDLAAVSQAGKYVWAKLTGWGLEDAAPAAELIVGGATPATDRYLWCSATHTRRKPSLLACCALETTAASASWALRPSSARGSSRTDRGGRALVAAAGPVVCDPGCVHPGGAGCLA